MFYAWKGPAAIFSRGYSGGVSAPSQSVRRLAICVSLFLVSACQDNRVTAPSEGPFVPSSSVLAESGGSALQVSQQYVPYDPLAVFGVSYAAFNADPYSISDAQFIAAAEATSLPLAQQWETDGEYVATVLTYNPGDGPPIEPTGMDPEPFGLSLGEEGTLSQTLEAMEALSRGMQADGNQLDSQTASTDACWTMYLRAARRCRKIPLPQGRRLCWGAAMVAYAACRANLI